MSTPVCTILGRCRAQRCLPSSYYTRQSARRGSSCNSEKASSSPSIHRPKSFQREGDDQGDHHSYQIPTNRSRRKSPYFRGADRIKESYLDALSSPGLKRALEKRPVKSLSLSAVGQASSGRRQSGILPGRGPNPPRKPPRKISNPFDFTRQSKPAAPSPKSDEAISSDNLDVHSESSGNNLSNASSEGYGSNLFDVFRMKGERADDDNSHALQPTKSGAFDASAFQQYIEMLASFVLTDIKRNRPQTQSQSGQNDHDEQVISWLRSNVPAVDPKLPSLHQALQEGLSPVQLSLSPLPTERPAEASASEKDSILSERRQESLFRSEVEAQQQSFCKTLGWTSKQYKMAQSVLYLMSNYCAKQSLGQPVQVIWEKVKEAGIGDKKLLHVLLHVSSTVASADNVASWRKMDRSLPVDGVSSILSILGAPVATTSVTTADGGPAPWKELQADGAPDVDESLFDRIDEIALFHDLLYEPTEQTIHVRVRLLLAQGKVAEADALLHEYTGKVELRLRTYVPVLLRFLSQDDYSSALRLFKKMQKSKWVHLDAATYVNLLASLARSGLFGPTAPGIELATPLGYRSRSGPDLFDQLVEEMSRDVMEIPLTSAKRLQSAFADGFPSSNLVATGSLLLPLKRMTDPAPDGSLVASLVNVDPSSGVCPLTGVKLRLIHLTAPERVKLKETILSMARSAYQHRFDKDKSPPSKRGGRRRSADEELQRFFLWLDTRNGNPFTVVVDAANVAYYLQNFDQGRFSFHQVRFVVDALESLGEHPLVVLPRKYLLPQFNVTIGVGNAHGPRKQVQTEEELRVLRQLLNSGKVYVVPAGCLDDYFWILASVSEQTVARNGRILDVEAGDSARWPGTRPVLLSNDQMRDHKLELLEPMLFRRWYSNFIVNYNFSGFVGDTCTSPEIGFSPADFFSREIQGNADRTGEMVWHFPIADSRDQWFCVRLPTPTDDAAPFTTS